MHPLAAAGRHTDTRFPAKLLTARAPSLLRSVVWGPLWNAFRESGQTSLAVDAILCSFGRAFISKGQIGVHYRAISRNGLVLLVSPDPPSRLDGVRARLRLAVWHRAFLRNEPAEPWGILLHATPQISRHAEGVSDLLQAAIEREALRAAALSIDLGGERILNFAA